MQMRQEHVQQIRRLEAELERVAATPSATGINATCRGSGAPVANEEDVLRITEFLEERGLDEFIPAFISEEIWVERIQCLKKSDLDKLRVEKTGPRCLMLATIAEERHRSSKQQQYDWTSESLREYKSVKTMIRELRDEVEVLTRPLKSKRKQQVTSRTTSHK